LHGIHFHFAAPLRPVFVLGADGCRLDAHRPDATLAPEERAQRVDRGQEVAAVLLHHRQQQIPAGVARQPLMMLERGQAREQHSSRLPLIPRESQRALQHVAGRQHPQLVAQLTRAPAAVEHGHDSVEGEPGIRLEAAEQAGKAGSTADAANVQLAKMHRDD
jgi:hypothetical protein